MSLAPVALPCCRCGAPAVQVTQPAFSPQLLGYIKPALKIAPVVWPQLAANMAAAGVRKLELPADGDLFGLFDPAELSQWLQVTCAACAVFPPAAVFVATRTFVR